MNPRERFGLPASSGEVGARFGTRPLLDEDAEDIELIRHHITKAATALSTIVPAGRDFSLVLTKLEEAMFWATRAVERSPRPRSVVE